MHSRMWPVTFYIFSFLSAQTWECVARLCWGQRAAPLPPRIHNCSNRNVAVIEKPSGKITDCASIWCFTALLDKEKENIQYMSIEKGKKSLSGCYFPPQRRFLALASLFSGARTHTNSSSPLRTAIKLTRDAPQWKLGNYHCHGDKKGCCPQAQRITMYARHMIIHKKEKDSKIETKTVPNRIEEQYFFIFLKAKKKIFSTSKWKKINRSIEAWLPGLE